MPKALCISGMVIAVLIILLFLTDFLLNMFGAVTLAPFKGAQPFMDIVFVICGVVLGLMSWLTFKEQV